MTETPAAPIRRVLLTLDAVEPDAEAYEAASVLAARLGAELAALFVEDSDLARLAALPFARELGLSSAARRPLAHGDVERSWRVQALHAQAAVSQAAERHRVPWSFRVLRAQVGSALVQVAMNTDLVAVTLAVGRAGPTASRMMMAVEQALAPVHCALLVRPAGAALRPPFVVLYDGGDAAMRALRLATQLARDGGGEIIALLVAADPARREQQRTQVTEVAAAVGVPVAARVLAGPEPVAALRALRPGTLVLAVDGAPLGGASRRQLPAMIGCPALYVR